MFRRRQNKTTYPSKLTLAGRHLESLTHSNDNNLDTFVQFPCVEQTTSSPLQTLSEMHEKMSSLQQEQYLVTSSFKDVHSILVDYGRRRGRPLPTNLEQLPSYEQSIGTLVQTMERDAVESEAELLRKNEKIQQVRCGSRYRARCVRCHL